MSQPKITLDQWGALVAVVEAGGYAQASARLHRTQSTVTYTIKKLEDLLGVKVFELQGRKAVLTPTGQVLYRRGKALLEEAGPRRARRRASSRAAGSPRSASRWTSSFPPGCCSSACAAFGAERPGHPHRTDRVRARRHRRGAHRGHASDLVIGGVVPGGFLGDPLMQVRFVCAAAPSHPLHQLGRTLTLDDLRQHRHLVVRDSGALRSRSGGWLNETALDRVAQGHLDPRGLHGPRLRVVPGGEHPRGTARRGARAAAAGRGTASATSRCTSSTPMPTPPGPARGGWRRSCASESRNPAGRPRRTETGERQHRAYLRAHAPP